MQLNIYNGEWAYVTLGGDFVNELKKVDVFATTAISVHGVTIKFDGDERGICHRCRRQQRIGSPKVEDWYIMVTNKRTIVVSVDGLVLQLPHGVSRIIPVVQVPLEPAESQFWSNNLPISPLDWEEDEKIYRERLRKFMLDYKREKQ